MALVTLTEVKTALSISGTTYDTFLLTQIDFYSEVIEQYCGRKFELSSYTQTIFSDELEGSRIKDLFLYHYPVVTIDTFTGDGEDISTEIRLKKDDGKVRINTGCFNYYEEIIVEYDAGFASIPLTLKNVMYGLIGEDYSKKKSGVDVNFGQDIQKISIPGAIAIDFDYSLSNNDRKSSMGMFVRSYANVLDYYKSERRLIGSIGVNYVE